MTDYDNCAICLDEITINQANNLNIIKLDCNHYFHAKCISNWFYEGNKTCPLCIKQYVGNEFKREEINNIVNEKKGFIIFISLLIFLSFTARIAHILSHTDNIYKSLDDILLHFINDGNAPFNFMINITSYQLFIDTTTTLSGYNCIIENIFITLKLILLLFKTIGQFQQSFYNIVFVILTIFYFIIIDTFMNHFIIFNVINVIIIFLFHYRIKIIYILHIFWYSNT